MDEISYQEYEAYLKEKPKEAERLLTTLARNKKLRDAFETEIGKTIVHDLLDMIQAIMAKIVAGELTEKQLTEGELKCPACQARFPIGLIRLYANYGFALELFHTWGNKIASYYRQAAKVKETAAKAREKRVGNA